MLDKCWEFLFESDFTNVIKIILKYRIYNSNLQRVSVNNILVYIVLLHENKSEKLIGILNKFALKKYLRNFIY